MRSKFGELILSRLDKMVPIPKFSLSILLCANSTVSKNAIAIYM